MVRGGAFDAVKGEDGELGSLTLSGLATGLRTVCLACRVWRATLWKASFCITAGKLMVTCTRLVLLSWKSRNTLNMHNSGSKALQPGTSIEWKKALVQQHSCFATYNRQQEAHQLLFGVLYAGVLGCRQQD